MFHVFHFLQTGMVFGIINPFLWILNAVYVSRDKNFPHFNAFQLTCIWRQDVFSPAESWLVNSNFRRTHFVAELITKYNILIDLSADVAFQGQ